MSETRTITLTAEQWEFLGELLEVYRDDSIAHVETLCLKRDAGVKAKAASLEDAEFASNVLTSIRSAGL